MIFAALLVAFVIKAVVGVWIIRCTMQTIEEHDRRWPDRRDG